LHVIPIHIKNPYRISNKSGGIMPMDRYKKCWAEKNEILLYNGLKYYLLKKIMVKITSYNTFYIKFV